MTHEQAMALVDALIYVEELGIDSDGHPTTRRPNELFLKAIRVADPALKLHYSDLAPYWQRLDQTAHTQEKARRSRIHLGAFLQEWGRALADCVLEKGSSAA